MLRPIKPIPLIGLEPKPVGSKLPVFGWADPKTLLVEDDYKRRLTQRSITLIRKIAVGFDWLHVKLPVCARVDGRQPEGLGLPTLLEPFPIEWGQQRTNWFGAVEGSEKATSKEIAAAHAAPRTDYRRQRNRRSIRHTSATEACDAAP